MWRVQRINEEHLGYLDYAVYTSCHPSGNMGRSAAREVLHRALTQIRVPGRYLVTFLLQQPTEATHLIGHFFEVEEVPSPRLRIKD